MISVEISKHSMMVGEIFEEDGDIVRNLLICKKCHYESENIDDGYLQYKILFLFSTIYDISSLMLCFVAMINTFIHIRGLITHGN